MSGLGTGVLYLVLIAIELIAPGSDLAIDYLQDGVPVATVEVTELPASDRDLYLVTAEPMAPEQGDAEEFLYRIEQSDLVSTNYLIYAPQSTVPVVVSLVPPLAAFPAVRPTGDFLLEIDFAQAGEASADVDMGNRLHVLPRSPYLVLSAPESGIILFVEPVQ